MTGSGSSTQPVSARQDGRPAAARTNPQFGHHGAAVGGCFIDSWGSGPLLMRYQGKEWWFEFSDRFGPLLLRKSDKMPADAQPVNETHPFWTPFSLWLGGGKKCRAIRVRRRNSYGVRFWICHVPRRRNDRAHHSPTRSSTRGVGAASACDRQLARVHSGAGRF